MTTNIILTGFMGTGKTTVGRLLAAHLGYAFVDTDVLIETRSGMTIADIFADLGEEAFRGMEQAAAHDLAAQQQMVIATGGRMMLDPGNAKVLGERGKVFCLSAEPQEILARVMSDANRIERPLLKVDDPQQRILSLLEERREKYAQFPQISTTDQTPQQVMQQIIAALKLS